MAEALQDAHLYELTDKWVELEQMIGDPDIDPEMLADAFEDIEGAFEEKAHRCALMFRNWQAAEGVCKDEADRITKRKKTFANKQEWMKGYLRNQMAKLNLTKIEDPVLPISRRAGALSVQVEGELPPGFTTPKVDLVPDKKLIGDVLKAHQKYVEIDGDTRLDDEQKEAAQNALLEDHDEWKHPYIREGIDNARLQRGEDIIKIG